MSERAKVEPAGEGAMARLLRDIADGWETNPRLAAKRFLEERELGEVATVTTEREH